MRRLQVAARTPLTLSHKKPQKRAFFCLGFKITYTILGLFEDPSSDNPKAATVKRACGWWVCDDQKGPSVLPIIKYIKKPNVHIPNMAVKLYAAIGSKDITNFNLDII